MSSVQLFRMGQDARVMIGSKLKEVTSTRDSVTFHFDPFGEFTRRIAGGEYRATSDDWYKPVIGMAVLDVKEYDRGLILDFGLHGILMGNDGNIQIALKKESGGLQ